MTSTKRWIVRGSMGIALWITSFAAGWYSSVATYPKLHPAPLTWTQRGTLYVPSGLRLAMTDRSPSNESFLVGDRIDVLVRIDDGWHPLVIDAVIASENWQTMALMVRADQQAMIVKAQTSNLQLKYRKTVVPY